MHIRAYFWINHKYRPESGLRYNKGYIIGTDDYGNAIMRANKGAVYWH